MTARDKICCLFFMTVPAANYHTNVNIDQDDCSSLFSIINPCADVLLFRLAI